MKTTIETISPDVAAKYLEKNASENRSISKARVDGFASDMKRGAWKLTHQGICFGKGDELIDGQHRLLAVIQSNKSVRMMVTRDPEAKFHTPIDRGRARSLALVSGRTNAEVAALAALNSLERGIQVRTPMSTEDLRMIEGRHREGLDALGAVAGFNKLRGGASAALVFSYPVSKAKVVHYAKDLINGTMLAAGHPAIAHRRWLDRTKQGTTNWDTAMVSLSCIRASLSEEKVSNLFVAQIGFRAISTRRRALGLAGTPPKDRVPSCPMKSKEKPGAQKKH